MLAPYLMSEPRPKAENPTVEQVSAMISLLGDDPGPLQESARARLLAWGERAVEQLRDGAEAEHLPTRARCRALLRAIEVRGVVKNFAALRTDRVGPRSASDLLEGALGAARMVRTFVPPTRRLEATLRREAAELRRACAGKSLPACARLLAERLHGQLGLRGCDAEQLDVEKQLLVDEVFEGDEISRELVDRLLVDRVLATKEGAPIALSLVYLVVARWAGLTAVGVALPDHFLVRLHGPRPLLVDPFHGGRVVTKSDCVRYLRSRGYERPRDHLRDLNDREVLQHYLQNVTAACARAPADTRAALRDALEMLSAR